jgi:multidrug efflux pump subunit AcrB
VRDRVNRILPQLPRTIKQPTVEKFDPDSAPVMTLAVSADKPIRDITEYADKTLRRQLESVNGVGQVVVIGGRQRQINITLDPARLQATTSPSPTSRARCRRRTPRFPAAASRPARTQMTLRTRGRVQSVAEFGDVVVKRARRASDPAARRRHVEDGMADATTRANVSGKPTVLLTIRRQSGVNTVQMVDAVTERLADIKAVTPPATRSWSSAICRVHPRLDRHGRGAPGARLVLAALVVLVFPLELALDAHRRHRDSDVDHRHVRPDLVRGLHAELDDDARAHARGRHRHRRRDRGAREHLPVRRGEGMNPYEAAVEATKEIGLAVLATTLSLIAIFVPVGFMGGIVGRFHEELRA